MYNSLRRILPQTICQNLDNLKPENGSNSIESNIFTFEGVPVNASFHSCIQRLIYPNVTLCDNYESNNYQGPTIEQMILPFFGVDPAEAKDDEGYTICPQYLTEVQCYGKVVKTPDDGYDVNDTSIERANKSTTAIILLLAHSQIHHTNPARTSCSWGTLTYNQDMVQAQKHGPTLTTRPVVIVWAKTVAIEVINAISHWAPNVGRIYLDNVLHYDCDL